MADLKNTAERSSLSYGHITVFTNQAGVERVLYLGYTLLVSKSELSILKALLLSLPRPLSTAEIAEATGISAGQISVLVNRLNRKAAAIGGRRLLYGTSHHGFRINEFM